MWASLGSLARSMATIAKVMEQEAKERTQEPEDDDLPLTKAAWRSEVRRGNTEKGFDDWLIGRGRG